MSPLSPPPPSNIPFYPYLYPLSHNVLRFPGSWWHKTDSLILITGKDVGGGVHIAAIDIHVHTYRNKDVQTYTDEQKDRQCRSAGRQAEKHTYVQKDDCILKDRQTDRQLVGGKSRTFFECTSIVRKRNF